MELRLHSRWRRHSWRDMRIYLCGHRPWLTPDCSAQWSSVQGRSMILDLGLLHARRKSPRQERLVRDPSEALACLAAALAGCTRESRDPKQLKAAPSVCSRSYLQLFCGDGPEPTCIPRLHEVRVILSCITPRNRTPTVIDTQSVYFSGFPDREFDRPLAVLPTPNNMYGICGTAQPKSPSTHKR